MKKERGEAFLISWVHRGDRADMTAVQVCQTRKCVHPKYELENRSDSVFKKKTKYAHTHKKSTKKTQQNFLL